MLNCCLSEKNGKLRMCSWKKACPEAPTLNEVVRLVAMLGSFLGRKGNGEPGIWQGLQQIATFVHGLRWARENQVL
ncbi:IS4 family transposase [Mycoavidus sp. HKI]|uniref:IS4 family transposase n=1 Tax=Mycoavidus sp. HKI TaxID=2840467 RepID=UPI0034D4D1B4